MNNKNKEKNIVNPYIQIGKRIQDIRIKSNLTEIEIANKLNISVENLQKIECGILKISMDVLLNISKILNCDINYFLTGISNKLLKDKIEMLQKYIETIKLMNNLNPKQRDSLLGVINSIIKKN